MKEFHLAFAKATTNKKQFQLLCQEAFIEMKFQKRGTIDTMLVFNNYYNLNFTLMELCRLGKFIESGEYRTQLERYV